MLTASRISLFGESVIREMTRLAMQYDAINLSQGFPDFDVPGTVKEAAVEAIRSGVNQYTVTWGYPPLRHKLAALYTKRLGWQVEADVHVTVTCGVSEALAATMLAIMNPGDEVIVIEPAHESFHPVTHLAGGIPVGVPLEAPDFRLDLDRLAAAITANTKALILNTPHNPSGRVFDAGEIAGIIDLVEKHNLLVITDEIYDRILYDGRRHISPGSLGPLRERTITCAGFGKTYSVTGWRLGYVVAPAVIASAIRSVHDFLTIGAPTPLQAAAVAALNLPDSFYANQLVDYHERRAMMIGLLRSLGFNPSWPEGAYYTMADFSQLSIPQASWSADRFARWLAADIGVAVVPGNRLYSLPGYGEHAVRFAFPKQLATLQEAEDRMARGFAAAST